jgi:hypothetical protein
MMFNSIGFIVGFSIVFITLRAISTEVGQLLAQYKSIVPLPGAAESGMVASRESYLSIGCRHSVLISRWVESRPSTLPRFDHASHCPTQD